MLSEVTGLILRVTPYGESDKILTVLTAEAGKLTVYAKGVRNYRSHYMSICQQMCYNEFVLYEKQGKYWLREAACVESFYHIRENLVNYALAQYCLDILDLLCVDGALEPALLQLGLNTMYLLERGDRSHRFLKAVFEMRCASVSGFLPEIAGCERCGETEGGFYLDVAGGALVCGACLTSASKNQPIDENARAAASAVFPLSDEILQALRYICYSPPKRVYLFEVTPEVERSLSVICESYLGWHIDRKFESLKFYKEMVRTLDVTHEQA